jgi:hypothetical protein
VQLHRADAEEHGDERLPAGSVRGAKSLKATIEGERAGRACRVRASHAGWLADAIYQQGRS